jgi:hypothetical protein
MRASTPWLAKMRRAAAFCASRNLDQESHRGNLYIEDSLEARGSLSADRCHLNDVTVRINGDDGNDAIIRKKYVMNPSVRLDQDVTHPARHLFKVGHEPAQVARGQRK